MDYITLALAKDYADQVAAGGGGSVDLKDYYKKSEVDSKLDEKVNKIEGKDLSTNDYTTEEKTKLTGIEDNAEVNKIDIVKINGVAAEIVDKAIDITIPGSKTYTYQSLMHNLPAIEIVNGEYGFTQENNTFSVEARSANSEYCTTYINITQENIAGIILSVSIMPKDTLNNSFLETNCTLSIYQNPSTNNTPIFESSKVGFQDFIVFVSKGDQLMLNWSMNGNIPPRDAVFSVSISKYITDEINTTELEEVMYAEADRQHEYTDEKTTDLANAIFTIRNQILPDVYTDEYQRSNSQINIPLSNNQEYRISLADNDNQSQVINVAFIDVDNLNTNNARYQTKLILQTSYRRNVTYTFNLLNGSELPLSGDDVTNNVFTTQRLKIYEITFTFNGFIGYGEIKSFSYTEPAT